MSRFIENIIDAIIDYIPHWLFICLLYSIAGIIIGGVAFLAGMALGKSVNLVLLVIGGMGGLIWGVFESLKMR
jgi:hypothetical protein